jgi:stearoyl-CoA desaturase (delta-9 desaturase)
MMWQGVFDLPIWGYVLIALALTHITIASVTIYLHRHQAHRGLDLHPAVGHFFRFWLWLTTGMVTKEWVAVHRKHHARCETEDDPHSPQIAGINRVLWGGAWLYRREAVKRETVDKFGHGTPNDWIERNLYSRYNGLGIVLMLAINLVLFGLAGAIIWAVQMVWIPFWAAGVINGIGHYWGYRNFEPADASRNISPVGVLIGGEELHNNHHAFPSSAKFSLKPWEFDIGWQYIRALSALGLARVKRVAPTPVIVPNKRTLDQETVSAIISNRLHVMSSYAREVIMPTVAEERRRLDRNYRRLLRRAQRALIRDERLIDQRQRERLETALTVSQRLQIVYEYRQRLQAVWARSATSHEALLKNLQTWCAQAEASGVQALREFSFKLRGYALQPAAAV